MKYEMYRKHLSKTYFNHIFNFLPKFSSASVAQWQRVRLPHQGSSVRIKLAFNFLIINFSFQQIQNRVMIFFLPFFSDLSPQLSSKQPQIDSFYDLHLKRQMHQLGFEPTPKKVKQRSEAKIIKTSIASKSSKFVI